MKIKIGSYSLADNLALLVSYRETPIRSPRQRIIRVRKQFQVQGIILGSSQSDLTTKIATASAALIAPNGDVGLYHDDGTTPSAQILDESDSDNGISLVGDIQWERADGVEYATQRTFSAAYAATYATPDDGDTEILRYNSRYRIIGTGGPEVAFTRLIAGLPVGEQVHQYTECRAVQSGERYGRSAFPLADAPIATGEIYSQRALEQIDPTPDEDGNDTNYGITWQYSFQRSIAFSF